jgi:hypothetical protein
MCERCLVSSSLEIECLVHCYLCLRSLLPWGLLGHMSPREQDVFIRAYVNIKRAVASSGSVNIRNLIDNGVMAQIKSTGTWFVGIFLYATVLGQPCLLSG